MIGATVILCDVLHWLPLGNVLTLKHLCLCSTASVT